MKHIDGKTIYTPQEVNKLARLTLENMSFWVEGEISSFKGINSHFRYAYFDIKDDAGYKVPCIMDPQNLQSQLEIAEGDKVLVLGSLTLWERDGRYQMYVHKIEEFGEGKLAAKLEELKNKLQALGYFDLERKRKIPRFPTNVAVITSVVSDGWQDFKKHTQDKYPVLNLTIFDVLVQGQTASSQITRAIKKADKMGFDAITLVRGGGSAEDLNPYNDEILAKTIFLAKTCIVVGVGHEKDVTIAQLVADIAASTPTDAAKLISADFSNLEEKLTEYHQKFERNCFYLFSSKSAHLDSLFQKLASKKEMYNQEISNLQLLASSLRFGKTKYLLENQRQVNDAQKALRTAFGSFIKNASLNLDNSYQKLVLLSPERTFGRGYSIAFDKKGKILKDVAKIRKDDPFSVKLAKGTIYSTVKRKEL